MELYRTDCPADLHSAGSTAITSASRLRDTLSRQTWLPLHLSHRQGRELRLPVPSDVLARVKQILQWLLFSLFPPLAPALALTNSQFSFAIPVRPSTSLTSLTGRQGGRTRSRSLWLLLLLSPLNGTKLPYPTMDESRPKPRKTIPGAREEPVTSR